MYMPNNWNWLAQSEPRVESTWLFAWRDSGRQRLDNVFHGLLVTEITEKRSAGTVNFLNFCQGQESRAAVFPSYQTSSQKTLRLEKQKWDFRDNFPLIEAWSPMPHLMAAAAYPNHVRRPVKLCQWSCQVHMQIGCWERRSMHRN